MSCPTLAGKGIVALPTKSYCGSGHRIPPSREQRSIVVLIAWIPYAVKSKLRIASRFSPTEAALGFDDDQCQSFATSTHSTGEASPIFGEAQQLRMYKSGR